MSDLTSLSLFSLAMFVGSFICGLVPTICHLSEKHLSRISALGAGLLVGTALSVIIPEGVHAVQFTEDEHESNANLGAQALEIATNLNSATHAETDREIVNQNTHNNHSHEHANANIGVSLVFGFVFMLLVDQIGSRKSSTVRAKVTATLGLVVHAAADGIALGASMTTSNVSFENLVFIAIMVHKGPAAFGLVSFLLHEGVELKTIRKHLFIFSAAAPLLAFTSYFTLQIAAQMNGNLTHTGGGNALLFSGGTFLYVAAVHVLPEIASQSHHQYRAVPANVDSGSIESGAELSPSVKSKSMPLVNLFLLVVGCFLPMILTIGHTH